MEPSARRPFICLLPDVQNGRHRMAGTLYFSIREERKGLAMWGARQILAHAHLRKDRVKTPATPPTSVGGSLASAYVGAGGPSLF